jgi:hypothetical protein
MLTLIGGTTAEPFDHTLRHTFNEEVEYGVKHQGLAAVGGMPPV